MNAVALPRITVPVFDYTAVRELANLARTRLGYQGYLDRISSNNFLHSLQKLGVAPFEWAPVEKYKRARLREIAGPLLLRPIRGKLDWSWRLSRLSTYTGLVPKEVIEKALEIRREAPEANFQVDYLSDEVREIRDPDPFLMVQRELNTPWYYIAVWDEPKFIV